MRKHLERTLSTPGILIFKEKHGIRYFVCNTKEDFCKAAMHVLRHRLKDGYWYYDEEIDSKEITKKQTAAYCGIVYKEPFLLKDKTKAQMIVDSNNLEAAYEFLYEHSDGEYQDMTIEIPEHYITCK